MSSSPAPSSLRFIVASCQYAPGLLDKEPAFESYGRIAEALRGSDPPQLALLVGDQVYVDATAGLYDPVVLADRFHRPYKLLYQDPRVSEVGRRLRGIYCMMDDHELEDNWEPIATAGGIDYGDLAVAVEGYATWERAQGPKPPRGPNHEVLRIHFAFDRGPVKFFMADTRTERCPRNVRLLDAARIMKNDQRDALYAWLQEHSARPKVVASPSILLPRRRWARGHKASALRSDAWDAYPSSLYGLLAHVAKNNIGNTYFVSGDEHIPCVARVVLRAAKDGPIAAVMYSIHSSPFYAPYPFANSVPEDLVGREEFDFEDPASPGTKYWCEVDTKFPGSGNGFASIVLSQVGGQWGFKCDFDFEPGGRATYAGDAGGWL
jgi:phosphodiesterase/alkaline phosphatase D-like protein